VAGADRAHLLARAGIDTVVVGLETVNGPAVLAEVVRALAGRVVFSLDLKDGAPLGARGAWAGEDAWSIAAQAVALGVRRLLVLDLARVGSGTGTCTEGLCTRLVNAYPEVEVSAGGGVRDVADLLRLRSCGVAVALAASALHDRRLRREDLRGL
jgi:phosphoribosylformimino-5-aminoimidazole carboxamide ribotide isomerase